MAIKDFSTFVSHAEEEGDGQFNNRYYSTQPYRSGCQPDCIFHSVLPKEKRLLTDEENQSNAEVALLVRRKRM